MFHLKKNCRKVFQLIELSIQKLGNAAKKAQFLCAYAYVIL